MPRLVDGSSTALDTRAVDADDEGVCSGCGRALWAVRIALVALVLLALMLAALSGMDARLALRLAPTTNAASGEGAVTQALLREWPIRLRVSAAALALFAALTAAQQKSLAWLLGRGVAQAPALLRRGRESLSRFDALLLLGLSAIAVVARLPFLSQPIRYDEALTYNEFASRSVLYAASYYPEPNNQVLYTLLVQASSVVLGPQPWALRVPALIAGVLLVPATYALGRLLLDRWTGLLAAAGVAGSSYLVEFSTLARGYTLQALLLVVAFALVVHGLRADRAAALLLAAICCWLGFWTIPTTLYGAAGIGAWLLVWRRRAASRPTLRELSAAATLAGLLVFLAYLPVLLVSGPAALFANRFVTPLPGGELVRELPSSLARTWVLWTRDTPGAAAMVAAVLVMIAAAMPRRDGGARLAAWLIPAVCLALVLAQRVVPFERVWLFLLPLVFILAARGGLDLAALMSHRAGPRVLARYAATAGATVALVVAGAMAAGVLRSGSVLASSEVGVYPDAAAATQALHVLLRPGDAVVTLVPASLPELQYYFRRAGMDPAPLVEPTTSGRLFVLASSTDPASLGPLLPAAGIEPAQWTQPAPEDRYGESALFVLNRVAS